MKLKFYITLAVILLFQSFTFANNISVKKVSLTDTNTVNKTVMIKLDLSWENSWRDDINWDAAWVFVKFKKKNGGWAHVTLSASGHVIGSGAKINVPSDRKGGFIYRTANGAGAINITDIKLLWNYGADGVTDLDSLETRVFATEMVYVPEGAFAVGDGSGNTGVLCNANYPTDYVLIQDTLSVPVSRKLPNPFPPGTPLLNAKTIWIDGKRGIDTTGDGTIDLPDFPTGYNAFYCMKYEVSQGQYADMLNTLSFDPANLGTGAAANKADLFFPYFTTTNISRFSISLQDSVYITPRPDRGCNQLTGFGLSFADWAGLRPISEFEFEKACRGPLAPVPNERAFVPISTIPPGNFKIKGDENGTETFENNWGIGPMPYSGYTTVYVGGDGGVGPHRVGIFATDTTSRNSSGASFYGIMDLTDNLAEYVVYYDIDLKFKGINGDGLLPGITPVIYHNVAGWPVFTWMGGSLYLRRAKSTGVSAMIEGLSQDRVGFRGVRYAPAEN